MYSALPRGPYLRGNIIIGPKFVLFCPRGYSKIKAGIVYKDNNIWIKIADIFFAKGDIFKNLIDIKSIETDGAVQIPTKFHLDKQKGVNLNIFYSANNGFFTQLLRMRFINNEWTSATLVMRNEQTIFKKIDENYPEKNSSKIFK